jgi:Domain of unknown function (DUF5615)
VHTLASALRRVVPALGASPRVYVDANMPNGLVAAMRHTLGWDVLFVLEDPALRRAPDSEHFVRALDLGRTLITLDHDFLNERKFPPALSPGVIICSAPDETGLLHILQYIHRVLFGDGGAGDLPLRGRTMEITPDRVA